MAELDFLEEAIQLLEGGDLHPHDRAFLNQMAEHHKDGLEKAHKAMPKLHHKHVKQLAQHIAAHNAVTHAYIAGVMMQPPPPSTLPVAQPGPAGAPPTQPPGPPAPSTS